ncbi:hypothetical protein SprV_0100349100 [Sparganum proliferum]
MFSEPSTADYSAPSPKLPSTNCLKWKPTSTPTSRPLSLYGTIRAVQQSSSRKVPGSDAIPAEICKHGGPQFMNQFTALYQETWRQGQVPQDFKDATIVHLYRRKDNFQLCDKHSVVSLLNIAGEIFPRVLPSRLNSHLEQGLLPDSQYSFRRRLSKAS